MKTASESTSPIRVEFGVNELNVLHYLRIQFVCKGITYARTYGPHAMHDLVIYKA